MESEGYEWQKLRPNQPLLLIQRCNQYDRCDRSHFASLYYPRNLYIARYRASFIDAIIGLLVNTVLPFKSELQRKLAGLGRKFIGTSHLLRSGMSTFCFHHKLESDMMKKGQISYILGDIIKAYLTVLPGFSDA